MCFKRLCSWNAKNPHFKKKRKKGKNKKKLISICIIAAFCRQFFFMVLHITLTPFIWEEVINTFSIIKALGTEDEILPSLKSVAGLLWTSVLWASGQKGSLDCPAYHWYWCFCLGLLPILQMASKLWLLKDRKSTTILGGDMFPWLVTSPLKTPWILSC